MFENLTDRLMATLKNIRGQGRLSEDNIKSTLREIRVALLEADVALPILKEFIIAVQTKALGQEVNLSLNPSQAFIKIVHDELVQLMQGPNTNTKTLDFPLSLITQPPAIILLAGLQGAGKTTTVAKLGRWLQEEKKKTVLVTSTDIYRPAAIQQLALLAEENQLLFFPSDNTQNPVEIAQNAIHSAKIRGIEVIIVDSAGRLHIDQEMMTEITNLHAAIQPIETLFVVDSMTGQDATHAAKTFNDSLPLTGVILTKMDGDARGGAALSVRAVTQKPIKFIGIGEKSDALEIFHPERIASRILGMGDVVSLVEDVQRKVSMKEAEQLSKKIQKGKKFDLEDFLTQLQQMDKLGDMSKLLEKLPAGNKLISAAQNSINDNIKKKMQAIIYSMTKKERQFPHVIRGSHKRRIAVGSGTEIQDVNRLLKQFEQMKKMLAKFSKVGNIQKFMRNFQHQLPN